MADGRRLGDDVDRQRRDRAGCGERLALGRDAERAGRELLRGLERHARPGEDAVALSPHVLGEVGAQLDPEGRLVLGEPLAVLRWR